MEIFNSPIEFGARLLLLLSEMDDSLGIDELVFFDFAMIHSADFYDEASLHPSLPNRLAELVRRREDIHGALTFYLSKGLMTSSVNDIGIRYSLTFKGFAFAGELSTSYHQKIKRQANWVFSNRLRLLDEMELIFRMDRAAS